MTIGDNTPRLNSIQIQDAISGNLPSPFLQKKSWSDAQKRDKTHIMLKDLIHNSQAPDKKKAKNENTKLKLLYNLYREGRDCATAWSTLAHESKAQNSDLRKTRYKNKT